MPASVAPWLRPHHGGHERPATTRSRWRTWRAPEDAPIVSCPVIAARARTTRWPRRPGRGSRKSVSTRPPRAKCARCRLVLPPTSKPACSRPARARCRRARSVDEPLEVAEAGQVASEKLGVPGARGFAIGGIASQLRARVFAQQRVQAEPPAIAPRFDADERCIDEIGKRRPARVGHRSRCLVGEAAREHRQPREHLAFVRRGQLPRRSNAAHTPLLPVRGSRRSSPARSCAAISSHGSNRTHAAASSSASGRPSVSRQIAAMPAGWRAGSRDASAMRARAQNSAQRRSRDRIGVIVAGNRQAAEWKKPLAARQEPTREVTSTTICGQASRSAVTIAIALRLVSWRSVALIKCSLLSSTTSFGEKLSACTTCESGSTSGSSARPSNVARRVTI